MMARGAQALRSKDRPISAASVERYLQGKFGENLVAASVGEARLARSLPPREIGLRVSREVFRLEGPTGVKGWGAAGR